MTRHLSTGCVHRRAPGEAFDESTRLAENLREVADLGCKARCRRRRGIVCQERAVFLERGPAPGRIDHDGVEVMDIEGAEVFLRSLARSRKIAAVRIKRTATALAGRHHDVISSRVEDSNGAPV